jgi:hypothetical protein
VLQGIHDRVAVEPYLLHLTADGLHVVWVAVADADDGMTAVEVEIFIAFSVEDMASAATHDVYVEEGVNVE